MPDREKVFDAIRNCITEPKCKDCPWEDCENVGHKRVDVPVTLMLDALKLLKEQPDVVLCKDCENWIPGYITDKDDFIPPKCGKYQQMVGHSAYDYCNLAKRKEGGEV